MRDSMTTRLSRRHILMAPLIQSAILPCAGAAETSLKGLAGIDRVAMLPGKTYQGGVAARPAFAYIVSLDTGEWRVLCEKRPPSYTGN